MSEKFDLFMQKYGIYIIVFGTIFVVALTGAIELSHVGENFKWWVECNGFPNGTIIDTKSDGSTIYYMKYQNGVECEVKTLANAAN